MKRVLIALLIPLAGCAATKQYQAYKLSAGEAAATLHVVRSNSAFGGAIAAPIYINKDLIGRIGPGGHLSTKIPLGKIAVSSTTGDILIDSNQNETYYVELRMPPQLWFMTPDFDVIRITKEDARSLVGEFNFEAQSGYFEAQPGLTR